MGKLSDRLQRTLDELQFTCSADTRDIENGVTHTSRYHMSMRDGLSVRLVDNFPSRNSMLPLSHTGSPRMPRFRPSNGPFDAADCMFLDAAGFGRTWESSHVNSRLFSMSTYFDMTDIRKHEDKLQIRGQRQRQRQ